VRSIPTTTNRSFGVDDEDDVVDDEDDKVLLDVETAIEVADKEEAIAATPHKAERVRHCCGVMCCGVMSARREGKGKREVKTTIKQ
jgi:hypothetical protein